MDDGDSDATLLDRSIDDDDAPDLSQRRRDQGKQHERRQWRRSRLHDVIWIDGKVKFYETYWVRNRGFTETTPLSSDPRDHLYMTPALRREGMAQIDPKADDNADYLLLAALSRK